MPVLIALFGFIVSGLVWRLVASIGFGIFTAAFIYNVTNDYLNKSLSLMNQGMNPTAASLLGIVGADDCISVMIGGLVFISIYKSLKMIFVRN